MKAKLNEKTFMNGLQKAKQKIYFVFIRRIAEYGEILLDDAVFKKEYESFTGNTVTSLAYGVYEDGNLTDVVFISGLEPPVHAKIQNGKVLYLRDPYEGSPRARKGYVEISDKWGDETSIKTLQSVAPKGGNGIVVTTGTEYSTFLENVAGLNVLSETFLEAENSALQNMKSWINPNVPIDRL